MVKNKEFSLFERIQIIELHAHGKSLRKIAEMFDTYHSVISKIIRKKEMFGTIKNLPGRGRKSCTSTRTDRQILREVSNGKKISVKIIKENLKLDCGLTTIRNRLHEGGFWGRIARRKPCLTKKNMKARLQFAMDHLDKPEDFWNKVIWSDESKFELFGSKRRQTVWRKNGKGLESNLTHKIVKHSKYVMVWGCFSSLRIGRLIEITGKMNAEMYKNILKQNLTASSEEMGLCNDFVFQQDNDPKHTSKLLKRFFEENDIQMLSWPSQSPDLNPIENIWDELDRKVPQNKRKSLNEFRTSLFETWRSIGHEIVEKLIKSIPKRLKLVIDAKGGPINY